MLDCSANQGSPGFGVPDSRGEQRGLDPDVCRAVAAAVLGDATRVRWHILTSQARIPALQSGQVDVVARTFTWTHSRDTPMPGCNFSRRHLLRRPGLPRPARRPA